MNNKILAYRLLRAFTKFKDNPALRIGNSVWTYNDLHHKSSVISNAILQSSAGEGTPVAILGSKSFMTYAGICGALLASHAYMPLNLKFPASRNHKMLTLSGAKTIVADEEAGNMIGQLLTEKRTKYSLILDEEPIKWDNEYPEHEIIPLDKLKHGGPMEIKAVPEDTAYLLFTSGSTGIPKGVPVSNINVCAYLDHVLSTWDFREKDRFSHTFDLTFDLSVHDMMVCWLSGACLCVPEDDSPFRLASYIRDQKISVWFSVPSVAVLMDRMRLLKNNALEKLRISFFCGEPLPAEIADKWKEAAAGNEVVNLYGPSEATIAISAYAWDAEHKKSKNGIACLGRIFEKQEYILLNTVSMKPSAPEGELCLGGSQVISAYLKDKELSKKYFIHVDEHPDKRWYRTGDLVSVDEDGDLFFIGRTDTEVKISGFRVNLLEIDATIRKAAGTNMVASLLDEKKTPAIVSFVSGNVTAKETQIMQLCKKVLPWYMIPEKIIFVDEMPLNVNGKIDRNKLKQMIHE